MVSHKKRSLYFMFFCSVLEHCACLCSLESPCIPLMSYLGLFSAVGSINISNILTGKCLAKIRADDPSVGICPRARPNTFNIRSSVQEALEDVTALFYDEERNEIYTGNRHGLVHVWSN